MKKILQLLLVENNPATRDVILALLPEAGPLRFRIEAVPRLAAALTRLETTGIDLILLDLGLPGSPGQSALDQLRQAAPAIPVIGLTATDDPPLATAALRAGAQDVLVPGQFSAGQLARAARHAITRQKAAATPGLGLERQIISEQSYKGILDSISDAVYIQDDTGAFLDVNLAAEKMYGYTREEFIGQTPAMLAAPGKNDLAALGVRLKKTLAGEPQTFGFWGRCKDGTIFPQEVRTCVGVYFGAQVIIAVSRDLTESQRAAQALQESEERYRTLVEWSPEPVIVHSAEGKIIYGNPAAHQLIGAEPTQELYGRPLFDFVHPDYHPFVRSRVQQLLAGGGPGPMAALKLCKLDGTIINVEVQGRMIIYDGVQVVCTVMRDVTAHQAAELALRESEHQLREAHLIAGMGSYVLDISTGRWTNSAELDQTFGINGTYERTVAGWAALVHPDDRVMMTDYFRTEVLGRGRIFNQEYRIRRHDNQAERWVHGLGKLEFDAAGQPRRMHGTIQDITERKQAEAQLQHSLQELRTLHAVSLALERPDLSGDDLLTHIVQTLPNALPRVAEAQARIELDGRTYRAGAPGVWTDSLVAPVTINNRPAGTVTVGYVRRTGAEFSEHEREWVENVARMIGLGLSEREALATVRRFNTELEGKVAQRTVELAGRNREVQALLQAIPDLVMRLRTDGTILHCQGAQGSSGLAHLACPPDCTHHDCAITDLLVPCLQLGRRTVAENASLTAETELTTLRGPVAVELRTAPSGAEEFVVFARDITARKRLDIEIAAVLEKERQASEMKTRFISVTSHEFRTPMAAAMGSVEILTNHLDQLSPEKRQKLFERINTALRRMTHMLDEVLLLNRMDLKRLEVTFASIYLQPLVQNVLEGIRLDDNEAHRFELHVVGEAVQTVTDANLLQHILANLLSNAVRYSPVGSLITVAVTADAAQVQLVVEDQGIGIPVVDRRRIFEPFERGSNVGTTKGTGLGLNIVQRMTKLLGGTIALADRAGGGTRFTLALPVQSATVNPA